MKDLQNNMIKKKHDVFRKQLMDIDRELLMRQKSIMEIMGLIAKADGQTSVTLNIFLGMNKGKIEQFQKQRQQLEQEEKDFLYSKEVQVNKHDHEHYDLMFSENYYKKRSKGEFDDSSPEL